MSDINLKKEVFRKCGVLNSVDVLHSFCPTFEVAQRDACCVCMFRWETAAITRESEDDVTLAAAASCTPVPSLFQGRCSCGNYGGLHTPDKSSCPAKSLTCHGCDKMGHIQECCTGGKGHSKGSEAAGLDASELSGAVVVTDMKQVPQP